MGKMDFHVSVKALVFDERQRLLLLREESGVWDLPGGRMEHGENFHGALQRECREEIGIAGQILDATPYLAWSSLHSDGFWKVILCFRMRIAADELHQSWRPSEECTEFGFFAVEALDELNLAHQMHPLAKHWRLAGNA